MTKVRSAQINLIPNGTLDIATSNTDVLNVGNAGALVGVTGSTINLDGSLFINGVEYEPSAATYTFSNGLLLTGSNAAINLSDTAVFSSAGVASRVPILNAASRLVAAGLDRSGTITLGTVSATSITLGHDTIPIELTGTVTVNGVPIGGSAYTGGDGLTLTGFDFDIDLTDTTIFTSAGVASRVPVLSGTSILSANGVDKATALIFGATSATGITIGRAGITTEITGTLTNNGSPIGGGTYTAGDGLTLTGSDFDIDLSDATIFTSAGVASRVPVLTAGNALVASGVDGAYAMGFGTTNATAITIGHGVIAIELTGTVTVNGSPIGGAGGTYTAGDGLTLTGADFDIDLSDTVIFTSAGVASRVPVLSATSILSADGVDKATALQFGKTSATSISIGRSGITTEITGTLTNNGSAIGVYTGGEGINLTGNRFDIDTADTLVFTSAGVASRVPILSASSILSANGVDKATALTFGTASATGITIGRGTITTEITGTLTNNGVAIGVYTAGDGLTLTGNDFDIDLTDTTKFTSAGVASRVPVLSASSVLDAAGVSRAGAIAISSTAGGVQLTGFTSASISASNGATSATFETNVSISTAGEIGFTAANINISSPLVYFSSDIGNATISHTTQASDGTVANMTIQAQSAYSLATVNETGGSLILLPGVGGGSGINSGGSGAVKMWAGVMPNGADSTTGGPGLAFYNDSSLATYLGKISGTSSAGTETLIFTGADNVIIKGTAVEITGVLTNNGSPIGGGGTYTAGDGLTLTGSDFDIDLSDTVIFTSAGVASRVPVLSASSILSANGVDKATALTFGTTSATSISIGRSGLTSCAIDGGTTLTATAATVNVATTAANILNAGNSTGVTTIAGSTATFTANTKLTLASSTEVEVNAGILDLNATGVATLDGASVTIGATGDIAFRPTGAATDSLVCAIVSSETKLSSTNAIRISSTQNAILEGSGAYLTGTGGVIITSTGGGASMTGSGTTHLTSTGGATYLFSPSGSGCTLNGDVQLRCGMRTAKFQNYSASEDRIIHRFPVDTSLSTDSATTLITVGILTTRPSFFRGSIKIWDGSMNVYVSNFSFAAKNVAGTVTVFNFVESTSTSGLGACVTAAVASGANVNIQATRPTGVTCTASITFTEEV